MEQSGMWRRVDLALIFIFIAFELIAGVAVYQRAVSNTTRIVALDSTPTSAHHSMLDSVEWRWEPRPNEEITNTYRPVDETGDTLEFAHKVIANFEMWRKATER